MFSDNYVLLVGNSSNIHNLDNWSFTVLGKWKIKIIRDYWQKKKKKNWGQVNKNIQGDMVFKIYNEPK